MRKPRFAIPFPEKGSFAWILTMMGLAGVVLIAVPFAFWYSVWYGESLKPAEIEKALADASQSSQAASMLLRVAEKISRGDESMRRWYPQVVQLSSAESPHLRRTAAWTMGKDTRSPAFRARLLELLKDGDLHVRRAAAVSLSAFQDAASRKELLAAIQPHVVVSTVAGSANPRIMAKDTTTPETAVARVGETFVEAGVFGTVTRVLVKDGEPVSAGQPLVEVTPPGEEIRDLLRALSKVGVQEDLAVVRPYLENSEEQVRKEAASAMRIIERRGNSAAGVRIQ